MLFETDLNDEVTGAGSVQQVTTRWRDHHGFPFFVPFMPDLIFNDIQNLLQSFCFLRRC